MNSIFIISFYKSRPSFGLEKLIQDLVQYNQQIAIIINIDHQNKVEFEKHNNLYLLKRENIGMNIGAWDQGWRYFNNFENYFFFQDECFIKDKNFIDQYNELLLKKSTGIVGETINPKWNNSWDKMIKSPSNVDIEVNKKIIKRVDFYKEKMREWKIDPGSSSKHLRALNWALSLDTLHKINGFPIGNNKEECIASEIAVSRNVESKKLKIILSDKKHFKYIGHSEWGDDGYEKKYDF